MSCLRMLCEHPEKYDPLEMFEHCVRSSVSIWGIPQELTDQIWKDVTDYLARIPERYLETLAWIFEEDSCGIS